MQPPLCFRQHGRYLPEELHPGLGSLQRIQQLLARAVVILVGHGSAAGRGKNSGE